jgi:hypothetical protein
MSELTWHQQRMLERYFAQSIKRNPNFPVVLSEGDSWFSFPGHANTIDQLDEMTGHRMSLLRLEESGDTLARITTGTERAELQHLFSIYPIDVLLFSGGGNDVVGPELQNLFTPVPAAGNWRDHIRKDAMDGQFDFIANRYHSLANLRDTERPDCWIITHGYDYVQPDGRPTKYWLWPIPINIVVGPWIKTNLAKVGIVDAQDRRDVIHYLIDRFNDTLQKVASSHDRYVAIDNRGTVADGEWNDELHPSREGFARIAGSFLDVLKAKLPGKF